MPLKRSSVTVPLAFGPTLSWYRCVLPAASAQNVMLQMLLVN